MKVLVDDGTRLVLQRDARVWSRVFIALIVGGWVLGIADALDGGLEWQTVVFVALLTFIGGLLALAYAEVIRITVDAQERAIVWHAAGLGAPRSEVFVFDEIDHVAVRVHVSSKRGREGLAELRFKPEFEREPYALLPIAGSVSEHRRIAERINARLGVTPPPPEG